MKTAKEILREMQISTSNDEELVNDHYHKVYNVVTDEDHVVNAMIVYSSQFVDKIVEILQDSDTPAYILDKIWEAIAK